MSIAKREEGKKVNSNINVTPMVDVMLVLLIIFMVITPMLNNKVNVTLPVVTAAEIMDNANKEDAITVAVTRDGRVFLGGDMVSLSDLGQKVADLEAKKTDPAADKSVYMRADERANYGKVMDTIDALRTGGVSQLNLLTDNQSQAT
ncbi:MAG TPA: biopolymer transporter ExbD [Acidobacteriaceae bacterium]|jgi:biopolymer transport protein ExbD/biopolymer transport protein TolR